MYFPGDYQTFVMLRYEYLKVSFESYDFEILIGSLYSVSKKFEIK